MDKILYGIRKNCNPKIVVNDYGKKSKKLCDYEMCSIEEIYTQIFESRGKISTTRFYDYLIRVSSELGLPSEQICKEYNTERICKIISNNSTRNIAIFDLLAKEFTSVESRFRKIGDSEYVEQRDGAFVYLKINDDGTIEEETDMRKFKDIFRIGESLESIRLVNREDDYKDLGILGEEQFQQVEMVYQMLQSILYQKDVDVESEVKDMNFIIQDTKFLRNLVETVLRKRTRLQVMDWINVLTEDEMNQVLEQIYDEAVNTSGIGKIEQLQELKEYSENLFDYEYGPRE